MKQGPIAIATLLYSPDYLPGVFTLVTQLNKLLAGKEHLPQVKTVLFVTPELFNDALTDLSRDILQRNFSQIIQIDPLNQQHVTEEQNRQNLAMLQRPELAFALIKARLWEHTEFNQILYLDADTLPLNDTLFDVFNLTSEQSKYQIGAAPDIGWPDMFNSGVMTIVPDRNIATELHDFIIREKSIDGADQGILNQFFNQNCGMTTKNDWIILPFLYNVTTPNNGYQCPPAMIYFKDQIKLIHFIGKSKPWKAWTVKDFISNEYTNLWHDIYNEFAKDNNISHGYAPIESDQQPPCHEQSQYHEEHHEEYHEEHHQEYYEEHHQEYHEEHHQEYHEEHHEEQHHYEEDHEDESHNLESYVHPEAIKEMEEKAAQQEQQLNEPIEKPPTPIQLPLDFKEWLTTFIEKDDTPAPEHQHVEEFHLDSQPESEYHEPTPEYHEPTPEPQPEPQPQTNLPPIEEKVELQPEPQPEPEPVSVYHFGFEDSNYLQKVERIFPGEVFAYETKPEEKIDELSPQITSELETESDEVENKTKPTPGRTHENPNSQTTSRLKGKFDCDESETASQKSVEEEKKQLHEAITTQTREEKKTHKRKKSVRERLSEMTAHIDFGLQDYIDIGGSEDEDDASKYRYTNVIDKGTGTHPATRR